MAAATDGSPTPVAAPGTPSTPDPLLPVDGRAGPPSHGGAGARRGKCPPVIGTLLLAKKVGAEFLGTFILVFCAAGAPIVDQKYGGVETLMGDALCSGLAVAVVIFSVGHISGAHLNPAVTVAFAASRRFPWALVPWYAAAQFSGSICASFTLKGVYRPFMAGGVTVPSASTAQAFFLEFIATFILMFVIAAVATDTRARGELAAVAVGAAVFLDVLLLGPGSGASMNPARTLGPAIASHNFRQIWIYMVAPVVGAAAGAAAYAAVKLPSDGEEQERRVDKANIVNIDPGLSS